ncbi:hypothetical protein ACH4SP_08655 [Streptomyces sp. NPDC021093]|uniref:hypothetical protein n=1 Tax=Streptomyces sp. NPDC021093 TaxID=3365112 RepID=UPI0037A78287
MKRAAIVAITAGSVAGAAFLGLVAGPAVQDWYTGRHDESATYATGAEAKESRPSVPRWLPDTAKDISYAMKTTGGDRLLKATLPTAATLPPTCKKLPTAASTEPALQADWFPKNSSGEAAYRCDLYYAYTSGNTLYAWQHNDDWITSNKAAAGH